MKKIFTFLSLALLAMATQAATIAWDSGTVYLPDSSKAGKGAVSAALYFIDSATYEALDLSTLVNQRAALATYSAKAADITGATAKTGIAILSQENVEKTDGTQYAVLIYTYGSGDTAQYKMAKGYATINDLGKQEGEAGSLASQTAWFTKAVPEPTALALIALGVAAFGLKRKHV